MYTIIRKQLWYLVSLARDVSYAKKAQKHTYRVRDNTIIAVFETHQELGRDNARCRTAQYDVV